MMSGRVGSATVFLACGFLSVNVANPQGRGGANWTAVGNDAERSSWVRTDSKISTDGLRKPGFQLLWKIKLENDPKYLNSLTPMVVLDPYTGYRGHKSLGFLGGSSDDIFGIDIDLGIVHWHNHLSSGLKPQGGSVSSCPGGMTSPLARPTNLALPTAQASRGGGRARGSPARSEVGEPGQGAVGLESTPPARGGGAAPVTQVAPAAPAAPRIVPPNAVYAISSDGMLQTMYVSNGADAEPPAKFLPAHANALGLIVVNNIAYAETTQGCGGSSNGVWAFDLTSREVTAWNSNSSGTRGTAGPAFGPDGTLYVTTGSGDSSQPSHANTLAALEPKSLKLKNWFTPVTEEFTSSPVVFPFQDKMLIAAAARGERIYLLDAATMGGSDHQTALDKTPSSSNRADFIPGALATWQDSAGGRWILAPAAGPVVSGAGLTATNGRVVNGAIVAWKVVDHNGVPTLQPGWVSRDMVSPLTPIVVDGVIFAVSSGEYRSGDRQLTSAQRVQRSVPAILYALDAATGKELWNSGNTIASFVHSGGLSASANQIYLGTYDGTLYAFGFPIEH